MGQAPAFKLHSPRQRAPAQFKTRSRSAREFSKSVQLKRKTLTKKKKIISFFSFAFGLHHDLVPAACGFKDPPANPLVNTEPHRFVCKTISEKVPSWAIWNI